MSDTTADEYLNLSHISREFALVAQTNGWQAYHTPKNLAAAIAVEASELLAEFQWLTPEQSLGLSAQQKVQVEYEIADVFMYLNALCGKLDINLAQALDNKMKLNKTRSIEI